jgi:hypothetical protein
VSLCHTHKRQAIEVAEGEAKSTSAHQPNVTIQHIMKVAGVALGTTTGGSKKISELQLHPKIALVALLRMEKAKALMNLGKVNPGFIMNLEWQEVYFSLCRDKSFQLPQPVTRGEFFSLASVLESQGVVTIGKSKEERNKKVSLSVHPEDIRLGIQDLPMLKQVFDKE